MISQEKDLSVKVISDFLESNDDVAKSILPTGETSVALLASEHASRSLSLLGTIDRSMSRIISIMLAQKFLDNAAEPAHG